MEKTMQNNINAKIGKIKRASELQGDEYATNILDENSHLIAEVVLTPYYSYDESEAIAELIVKAVNERQRLLDSNRELLEALENLTKIHSDLHRNAHTTTEIRQAKTAINNAKNIHIEIIFP